MAIPQTFDEAFARVKELVTIFKENESFYTSSGYNEADARKDFIDKFWTALGWDVNHEQQTDPYKQDVKVERGVATSEFRKRADYAFLAENFRDIRFFVEAKKPHAGIDTPLFYFQTIRYGWNSHVPISVLHDFEEMRILDCRYKPDINTALGHAVLKYRYTDYANEQSFRTIYYLFSREAVTNGSIQEFAKGLPKISRKRAVRGVATDEHQSIDESFLQELDNFREELARAYKRKNPELDSAALTEVTQRTLDRLVFMRFLEDKLIESDPLIEDLHKKGKSWENFIATSRRLDRVYNGIIFKEHSLLDSDKFNADERVFDKISQSLSHRESPYDFNAIPIHILGSIYERFLGKVIVATAKQARVEDKPEVRKAGGVYYTPEYIVRYIVENTVGKLIEGKTPAQIQEMRFADIACGSGSFLLGVYDTLLRYHAAYYNRTKKNREIGRKAGCIPKTDGTLQLSLLQKRQILVNNIYGVDIDPQAVEVAQLSLYLKLLEDEDIQSAKAQQRALHAALLPSLSDRIVCGNSLIEWDILEGKLFDSGEERKLNPMNFEDKFSEVMKRGGFDAIVGNPPYGAEFETTTKRYLTEKYSHQSYQLDSYLLFLEHSVRDLLKPNGLFGMIIPNPWLTNLRQDKIRRFVTQETAVQEIVHFRFPVFPKVTVDTEIVILKKAQPATHNALVSVYETAHGFSDVKNSSVRTIVHDQKDWKRLAGDVINIFLSAEEKKLVAKVLGKSQALSSYLEINVGVKPYQAGKGTPVQTKRIVETRPFDSTRKESDLYRKYLRGRDIGRYVIAPLEERFIKYGVWLAEPRPAANFDAFEKIFMRQTGDKLVAALDSNQLLCLNNMHVLVPTSRAVDLRVLLGIVNSRLLNWFYRTANPEVGEALAEVKRTHVAGLPIPLAVSSDKANRIVQLVDQMLEAKKQLASAQTERDKALYENKSATLDRQIDQLVYELYELTPEEIAIIEGTGH